MRGPAGSPTRAVQIGFIVVLLVALGQVAWWIVDQRAYTLEVQRQTRALYDSGVELASQLAARGDDPARLVERFRYLAYDVSLGQFRVDADALGALREQRRSRLNQYGWEGGFFLVVLIGCVAILGRLLHLDNQLRRRQRNFLAAVSHEFKSPLASLQLGLETLGMRTPSDEDRDRLVVRMLQDVNRLGVMVANILNTSRLERGSVQAVPESLALAGEVDRAIRHLQNIAERCGVTVANEVGGDLSVLADPVLLQTVLANLLDNALKASAHGNGTSVRVSAETDGSLVVVRVQDDGIGFEPAEADRLFQQFYRPGDEMRREMPGTGLGLYVVRQIVRLSGGRAEAVSPGPGRGATVTTWWPIGARTD